MKHFSTFRILCIITLMLWCILPAMSADKEQREPNEPAFSADGTQLVFRDDVTKAGEVLPSSSEIWIIKRDGTGARQLTSGFKDSHPRFSTDGQLVAFTRDRDIWTVKTDGSGLRNITNTKNATESNAEFTHSGDLVFLRDAYESDKQTDASAVKAMMGNPLFALGFGTSRQSVVLHRLTDNSEQDILGNGYAVTQIAPNPVFDNAIFVLCKPLDANGKPIGEMYAEDKVIAVVKLDGAAPRTVFAPKPESKIILQEMRVTPQRNVLVIKTPDQPVGQTALLEDNNFVMLPDAPIFSDISQNGKTIVGTGIVKGQDSLFGIVLYDIATKTTQQLIAPKK